jgi:hypothetical protein
MVTALLAVSCFGQAIGIWKMTPAKSWGITLDRFPKLKPSATSRTWKARFSTLYSVRADGASDTTSRILHLDGKEYACDDPSLADHPDTVVSRRLDARTTEILNKKAGRVVVRLVRTISSGGMRMTLDVRITPGKRSESPVDARIREGKLETQGEGLKGEGS